MWTYHQATGELFRDGELVATGYSGQAEGKNNPALQAVAGVGPIPQGRYRIGARFQHAKKGPVCMRLAPCEGTDACGRGGFLIHGDSRKAPGTASRGCIILPRAIRESIAASKDRDLEVVGA